jgi:hypothetical protein
MRPFPCSTEVITAIITPQLFLFLNIKKKKEKKKFAA